MQEKQPKKCEHKAENSPDDSELTTNGHSNRSQLCECALLLLSGAWLTLQKVAKLVNVVGKKPRLSEVLAYGND